MSNTRNINLWTRKAKVENINMKIMKSDTCREGELSLLPGRTRINPAMTVTLDSSTFEGRPVIHIFNANGSRESALTR